jgi:hypothetical protein
MQARTGTHATISHHNYDPYFTAIKLIYNYSDGRPWLQSSPPFNLLDIGGKQRGSPMYPYHAILMICSSQQSNLFTSILRLGSCYKACPLQFVGPWMQARTGTHATISHHNYDPYFTAIKLIYKYSDARPRLQSSPPFNLLDIGGRQRGSPMYPYHAILMICSSQQSNLFASFMRLDQGYNTCPFIC